MNNSTSLTRPVSTGFSRLCLALLGATVALIALGGLVRITGSGLGCPDWPLCHGHLIPPMQLAPWIEYFHRLAAATVSLLVVAFCGIAWWRYRKLAWVIWPAGVAPLLLVAQILLGRLTVLDEIPPTVAWIHTAVAMAILACVAVPACATYPPLLALSRRFAGHLATSQPARRLPALFTLSALAVYLLLLTGAYVTRSGASAACPGFPGCGVELGQGVARSLRDIHMLHRIVAAGAGLLLLVTLAQAWQVSDRALRGLALVTGLTLLVQIGLGMTNVLLALPIWSRGLHLTVAAVLWAEVMILTVVVWRGGRMELAAAGEGQPVREAAGASA
jgi:heme A synthase